MQEQIQKFIDDMRAQGHEPRNADDIKADDKWHNIAAVSDKPRKKSLSYRLKIDDEFVVGNYRSHKEGVTYDYFTNGARKKYTVEEKAAIKARIEAEKAARQAEREAEQAAAAEEANKRWDAADLPDTHPYLERKGIKVNGARLEGENLLIPQRDESGKIVGLQTISPDGEKRFISGSKKQGTYYLMAARAELLDIIFICEGFATGASIRDAMGFPIVVAFDAGNLEPVAQVIRAKYPTAQIIIAADNDAFTIINKEPRNVGLEKGQQAATAIAGYLFAPEFDNNEETKYTDWNDYHAAYGLESLGERISVMLEATMPHVAEPDGSGILSIGPAVGVQAAPVENHDLPFRILGYNEGVYYYFPFDTRQIVALSAAAHTLNNLLQLADLETWKQHIGGIASHKLSNSQISAFATNELFRRAHKRGVFKEENRVRGCGAWMDAGRKILHCGDVIYVDGVAHDPIDVQSKYVYIAAPRLLDPHLVPLNNSDAVKLRHICEMPSWETPLSGGLLAGWLVIAPVCSILNWRPHIWITGEAEAGKSTILDNLIKPVLGDIALNLDGGTTEPAIRTFMGYDGRPIIYDEADAETPQQRSVMSGVMSLVRKASSGATVAKFGQRAFKAQFCACFSAINPPVSEYADESRLSMLVLKKNREAGAQQKYEQFMDALALTITPEFQRGLLARVVENMPVLLENIKVFRKAAVTVLRAARVADQIGAMLAGLYLLGSTKVIEQKEAEDWIARQDWTTNTAVATEPDYIRLLRYISTSILRGAPRGGNQRDMTIGELINALVIDDPDIPTDFARRTLSMYSINVTPTGVNIGHRSQNLARVLHNTPWDLNWHRTLANTPSAVKVTSLRFSAADRQRAIRIPLKYFTGIDDEDDNDSSAS